MKSTAIASLLAATVLAFFQTNPPPETQICAYTTTGLLGFRMGTCPATTAAPIGLPLTAKDGNGTAIFQAGTAVVCPSAIPGPGAAGPQLTCPAALYLPLQLVSVSGTTYTVADNMGIGGSGNVVPFSGKPPRMVPGYTVAGGSWVETNQPSR